MFFCCTKLSSTDYAFSTTLLYTLTMGIKTRFSDYGLGQEVIEKIITGLKAHKMTKLGECGKVTPEIAGKVLELSL